MLRIVSGILFKYTHTLFVVFTEETLIVQIPTISQCPQGQNKCWAERENFPKKARKKPLSSLKTGERGNIEAYRIIPIISGCTWGTQLESLLSPNKGNTFCH